MQELEGNKKKTEGARREACRIEEEETKISDEKIDHQLKKLKGRKATGTYRIPAEAWKYCEGQVKRK